MADEKNDNLKEIHGIKIDTNGHDHATRFMEKHMDREQLHEMAHNAKNSMDHDHNSHFTARDSYGHDIKYKLEYHHDGYKIERVHRQ